ncbi:MAG: hypothetical protein ABMA64_40060, partial [Myxococcota bacterium]
RGYGVAIEHLLPVPITWDDQVVKRIDPAARWCMFPEKLARGNSGSPVGWGVRFRGMSRITPGEPRHARS